MEVNMTIQGTVKTKQEYQPALIEPKWKKVWEEKPTYKAEDFSNKPKFYALVEFPYPSGDGLHVGHAWNYMILDPLVRKKRMEGFNVLNPIGWDAFGLPTENYAVKSGIQPAVVTKQNTQRFREQLKMLSLAYNWDREVNTTDPNYYKWTQWIFVQMFKHGLAYKSETPVGWCPSCKIVLAQEEIVSGKCERCGAMAEERMQKQWILRITSYADRLADELDLVDYPESAKSAQRKWIGRSEGLEEDWQVEGMDLRLKTFTTWPHTTWGATFMVIAPEHPIIKTLTEGTNYQQPALAFANKAVQARAKDPLNVEKNKEGFFLGRYVINPLSGRRMPLYIANFAIYGYGTGIVKCTPTHDQRDFEFAKKYGLDFVPIICPKEGKPLDPKTMKEAYTGEGTMVNAGQFDGMSTEEAREAISEYSISHGHGRRVINYHLRDWIFSRQHYWGEPIPMVYCESCANKGITWWQTDEVEAFKPLFDPTASMKFGGEGEKPQLAGWFPLDEDHLPLKLPEVEKYQPTDTGESPLANIESWVATKCPNCGEKARRETDTMPNWAGSSWYYLRYCDVDCKTGLADNEKLDYWMPVDIYMGGAEHTTLHLLYSRFWHKFLNDIGVAPGVEPYKKRRQHGIILAENSEKMSKSRGNVINPDKIIDNLGLDAMRVYMSFMGPYDQTMPWSTNGAEGSQRFLKRVWNFYTGEKKIGKAMSPKLAPSYNRLIKKVSDDIDSLKNNTAVAAMMEFLNLWGETGVLGPKEAEGYLKLLSPFAPHMAEELWVEVLKKPYSITNQSWPKYKKEALESGEITIMVQIDGKTRGSLKIPRNLATQKEAEDRAKLNPKISQHLKGKSASRVVWVEAKLINFVTN